MTVLIMQQTNAVAESHEPGSTFKLVDLMAILEDKADTSTVYDTYGGEIRYSGKAVRDSHKGGYGKYLWLEDSSYPQIPLWFRRFTKLQKITLQNLSTMNSYGLNKKLNMDFEGKAGLLFRNQATKLV
jgi:cell division protein FtsI (penicillin-binding protein 3)